MIHKRAHATLVGALLAFSACAPARPAPLAPSPAPREAPLVVAGVELRGESVTLAITGALAARRDILGSASYDLPMEANGWVASELDFLVGQRREVVSRWLERGDYYGEFVQGVLRNAGVPTDLYHLAMIESGFLPTARSRAGAVGFWQLMPGTATGLGLRVDSAVDERMDPVRSTRAAARHLRDLRKELGDWSLATAAYNAGSGRIGRGLRAIGATDFWDLAQRGDLAAETKNYVPRLYAVTVIGRDRERFGFRHSQSEPFAFDSIQVEYATPLSELARIIGVSEADLTRLNPHFVHGTTPAGAYWVWVPAEKGVGMQRLWLASDFRKEQGYGKYAVRNGDTLEKLADLSAVRASRIRELNPELDFENLQIGDSLRFPLHAARELSSRPVRKEKKEKKDTETREEPRLAARDDVATHTVESGETLSGIARHYGVSVDALRDANGLDGSAIRGGQALHIPSPAKPDSTRTAPRPDSVRADSSRSKPEKPKGKPEKVAVRSAEKTDHVVRDGESLWTIAQRYGSSVAAIESANHLSGKSIQPGQRLMVPVSE
jgi:membrane-bound lytic murein transglycosylase D